MEYKDSSTHFFNTYYFMKKKFISNKNLNRNGSLDLLLADSPVLDYYRATDHGCSLQRIGDTFVDDSYAIGMAKGFPLKDSISALIAKYSNNGYLDILTEKWYGGLPCFKFEADIVQPRPLGKTFFSFLLFTKTL